MVPTLSYKEGKKARCKPFMSLQQVIQPGSCLRLVLKMSQEKGKSTVWNFLVLISGPLEGNLPRRMGWTCIGCLYLGYGSTT